MGHKNIKILQGLKNIPPGARILKVSTPVAWLVYVEMTPAHCYYITVDKK